MKEERLKELLDKYYEGETSEAEEAELKKYFSGDGIIDGYDTEREIFKHYSQSEPIPLTGETFRDRIVKAVDDHEKTRRSISARRRYLFALSAAAAIPVLIGSYFIFFSQKVPEDTFSDPRIAYTETMKILNEVSVKLNKGTMALQPLGKIQYATETGIETVDRSAELISKNLQKIKLLEQISGAKDNSDDKNQK